MVRGQLGVFNHSRYPAGIWCKNDVVLTLMRRDDVASTLIRRHFRTKCPLGTHIGSVVEMYSLTNIITMGTQLSDHMTSKLSQNDINATLSCRINVIMTSFACWKKTNTLSI